MRAVRKLFDLSVLKSEEQSIFELRSLYRKYGYLPYKMGKFEEYDFYVRNKDFLISDSIITFNDSNGKLMALKPDVTLSIVNHTKDIPGCIQRVYYNENVYRQSGSTHEFKEIMQAGVECIGDIDFYNTVEVLELAAQSLEVISHDFVLEISHLGITEGLLDEIGGGESFRKGVVRCIGEKNAHEIAQLCAEYGICDKDRDRLTALVHIYGDMRSVVGRLGEICTGEMTVAALGELSQLCSILETTPYADRIQFDFSVVSDMNYYNGIVFKGYIAGVVESILSGGRYDKLMRKIGRKSGAVGFAIYPHLIEQLKGESAPYDFDVLVIYSDGTDIGGMMKTVKALRDAGNSVSVQKAVPDRLRCRQLIRLNERGEAIE